jgi:hypothetical protein
MLDTQYNPMDVAWGKTAKTGMPYVSQKSQIKGPPTTPNQQNVMGPQTVQSTGAGPFDAAYRQNLAVQAGGQWARPGGSLSFNPTGPLNFGAQSGGGNAPTFGLPPTLLSIMGPTPSAPAQPKASPAPAQPTGPSQSSVDAWLQGMGFNWPGMNTWPGVT